jgi:hypothetical protein
MQAWVDYFGLRQFNPAWALEVNPGASFLLDKEGWNDYYLSATGMFTPLNWFEVDGGIEGHWTVDPLQENSLEIRPNIATIFTWATYGKYLNLFYPAVVVKFEERYIFYQETGSSQTLSRLRLSVVARFPLNSPILDPGTWYLRFKAEGFYDLNGEANIRFASKRKLDAGIGHVVSPFLRLEFSLIAFMLRDNAEGSYQKGDLVFWFAVRHFY